MNYFIDTEFIENGRNEPLRLISIGIVDSNGLEYYAEASETDLGLANSWVKENVVPHLTGPKKTFDEIRNDILKFVGYDPVFWGWFSSYDWVIFCQIMGRMIDLPKGWPMYCRDLKQRQSDMGVPRVAFPVQSTTKHHALADAQWNKEVFEFLEKVRLGTKQQTK